MTHGLKVNFSGTTYNSVQYTTDKNGFMDYDAIAALAKKEKTKANHRKATAVYPRQISPYLKPKTPGAKAQQTQAKPVSKPPSKPQATEQEFMPLPLDLRLPHELVDQLEPVSRSPTSCPGQLIAAAAWRKAGRTFGVSAQRQADHHDLDREKLESDNFLDKVDGAQLNFEFRQ